MLVSEVKVEANQSKVVSIVELTDEFEVKIQDQNNNVNLYKSLFKRGSEENILLPLSAQDEIYQIYINDYSIKNANQESFLKVIVPENKLDFKTANFENNIYSVTKC